MVDTIYVEKEVLSFPVTEKVIQHYHRANVVSIEKYAEVFNVKSQNFRAQKKRPSLILAKKYGKKIISAPDEYEIGGDENYYFSHMLNCVYDCRYCFLQGMYRSANYLLFANYDDFAEELRAHVRESNAKNPWYFSGYDCDSLALEPITGFANYFLKVFSEQEMSKATLELRTKSTQIRSLLNQETLNNVVVAFSLNPDAVISSVEAGTPELGKRLHAIKSLQDAGWKVGIRFDPVIWHNQFETHYRQFFQTVFETIHSEELDSITLGAVRLPKDFHKKISNLYPEHWLFKAGLELNQKGLVTYNEKASNSLLSFCQTEIEKYVAIDKLYIYR